MNNNSDLIDTFGDSEEKSSLLANFEAAKAIKSAQKAQKQLLQLRESKKHDIYAKQCKAAKQLSSSYVSERMKKRSVLNNEIFKRDGIDYKAKVREVTNRLEAILKVKKTGELSGIMSKERMSFSSTQPAFLRQRQNNN